MKSTALPILESAAAFINTGMSIIPIDHTTKRPLMRLLPRGDDDKPTWAPFQKTIADVDAVAGWFENGCEAFAVVCGAVSGGLLILDFDEPRFYDAWKVAVGPLADGLPTQKTGGGGYQVLLRCPQPGMNDKLAWIVDTTQDAGRRIAIETRGEGGYAVVAPSLHPSGNRYQWIVSPFNEADEIVIPTTPQAQADALLSAARKLDECPHTRQEQERIEGQAHEEYQRRQHRWNGERSVIDAFNQAHSIEAMLEAHSYTRGYAGRYIRPSGKSESVSIRDGRSTHFSSNDPLNDGRSRGGYGVCDPFDVFVQLDHRGDMKAAVKDAATKLGIKHEERKSKPDSTATKNDAPVLDPSNPLAIVDAFLDWNYRRQNLRTLHYANAGFYGFNCTAYSELPPDRLRAEMYSFLERAKKSVKDKQSKEWEDVPFKPTKGSIDLAMDALRGRTYIEATPPAWLVNAEEMPDARELIVASNGIVDISAETPGLFGPPTPELFAINALDYEFDPAAPVPKLWEHFLHQLWPDDPQAIDLLQQWFGYVLSQSTAQQKILMLVGPTRSGKGTIARILGRVIGIANVCGPTLASFGMNFGLWSLVGKQLAIVSDARLSGRTDQAVVVERLLSISGEDTLTIDRKHSTPLTMKLPTRLMIISNELPRLSDSSGALVDRLLILSLSKSFLGNEDTELTEKLTRELPGILLWAIRGWKQLQRRGQFAPPPDSLDIATEMMDLASPVSTFIRDWCNVTNPTAEIPRQDLFEAWTVWCRQQGRDQPGAQNIFGRDLRAATPGVRQRQTRQEGDRVRVYVGIALTPAAKAELAHYNAIHQDDRRGSYAGR